MKTFTAAPCFLSEKEILTILSVQGWFIGRGFEFGDKSNFGSPLYSVKLSVVEVGGIDSFVQSIPLFAVWQLGLSPMIALEKTGTVNTEVFLVCHRPIVLNDKEYVVGYDRRPFELVSTLGKKTEFPLGRIDLWDLGALKKSTFPSWKGITFRFVTIAP